MHQAKATDNPNVTPNGKHLAIYPVANSSLYMVGFEEGGELPARLKNAKFTSPGYAQKEIEQYLEKAYQEAERNTTKATRRK